MKKNGDLDCMEIQTIILDIFLSRKRNVKEKKYDYKAMYKGEMMCHFQVVNKET